MATNRQDAEALLDTISHHLIHNMNLDQRLALAQVYATLAVLDALEGEK